MKRSQEIEQLVRQVIEALDRGDLAYIDRVTSREPGVVSIGSDANEYARGYEQVMALLRQAAPGAGMQIHARLTEVRGYDQGDTGLADGTGTFERDGQSANFRFTVVVIREQGDWRVLQNHASIGVPNDHMFDPLFAAPTPAHTGRD